MKKTFLHIIIVLYLFKPWIVQAEVIDGIAANANGQIITMTELEQRLHDLKLDKSKRDEVLNTMIDEAIVESEIRKRGLSASPSEVDEALNQVSRQNGLRTNDELITLLKEQGLTETKFRDNLKRQIEQGKFVNYVMGAKIKVSDQEVQSYYAQNYLQGEGAKGLRLRSIFLNVARGDSKKRQDAEQTLKTIQNKLKKGGDFSKLAKQYSQAPDAKNGGLLGDFQAGELQDDFYQAVAQLQVGQVSEPVEREEGIYLLKLESTSKVAPPPLKRVEGEIVKKLQAQEMDRLFRIWIRQAREKAFIDIKK